MSGTTGAGAHSAGRGPDVDHGHGRDHGVDHDHDARSEETLASDVPPPVYAERRPPAVAVTDRRDRVRWGAVWAGVIVALPTFLLIELALFAVGGLALGLDPDESTTTAGWVTGLVALVAFFLGGLTAGASALWKGASDGLLHGILVWALSLVGILFFTLLGGGALLGPVSEVITAVSGLQQQVAQGAPAIQLEAAVSTARDGAGVAVLGLGLSIAAAAIGGLLGVKMWPRDSDQQVEPTDHSDRH